MPDREGSIQKWKSQGNRMVIKIFILLSRILPSGLAGVVLRHRELNDSLTVLPSYRVSTPESIWKGQIWKERLVSHTSVVNSK